MARFSFSIIFFLLIHISGQSQNNLVPNPSFENITSCPTNWFQFHQCVSWFSPNNKIPDLYNTCSSDPILSISVPRHRVYFYKLPHSGNGYVGISAYFHWLDRFDDTFRRYISCKLINPIKKGKKYYAYFHVSPIAPDSNSGHKPFYVDAIGLTFTRDSLAINNGRFINLRPAIENKGTLINQPNKWLKVNGCYTPNEDLNYLTIGNFYDYTNTIVFPPLVVGIAGGIGYLYIDDVGVHEYDPLPDTLLLCEGEQKRIGGRFLAATYRWNTGQTDSTMTIDKAGTYILTATIDGCELSDTVVVINPAEQLRHISKDTTICKGQIATLQMPMQGTFSWSTGATQPTIVVREPNLYSVTVSNACGTFRHTFEVKQEICGCNVFVPNAFSPNGDGVNDELACFVKCDFPFEMKRFEIFNRWGGKVYQSVSKNIEDFRWNGKFEEQLQENGTYIWFLEYEYLYHGKLQNVLLSGDCTLVR